MCYWRSLNHFRLRLDEGLCLSRFHSSRAVRLALKMAICHHKNVFKENYIPTKVSKQQREY